mgnify:CR=1 FL=1
MGASMKEIKNRIKSVQSTRQIGKHRGLVHLDDRVSRQTDDSGHKTVLCALNGLAVLADLQ